MKKILLTGFEKFGDYHENISEVAASSLKILGDYEVHGLVFPVRIFPENGEDYGETILAKAREIKADAIISMGIASATNGFRIETRAVNWVENHKYCIDAEQRRVLDESLILKKVLTANLNPWHLKYLWDVAELFEKLRDQKIYCDVNYSHDAGTFCCNALMFRTLNAIEKQKCEIPYLFLHVNPSLELNTLQKILEAVLENL